MTSSAGLCNTSTFGVSNVSGTSLRSVPCKVGTLRPVIRSPVFLAVCLTRSSQLLSMADLHLTARELASLYGDLARLERTGFFQMHVQHSIPKLGGDSIRID